MKQMKQIKQIIQMKQKGRKLSAVLVFVLVLALASGLNFGYANEPQTAGETTAEINKTAEADAGPGSEAGAENEAVAAAETSGGTETGAETNGTAEFTDIGGHWAEAIIKEAAKLGIAGGYPDKTYKPDNLIKREEFYKLLTNILTVIPDTSNTKIPFTDVDEIEWYVPTIKIAVASNITSGYGDGTFGIGLMISRQEAAKVAGSVIPAADRKNAKSVDDALDRDVIADWAYDYVDLMYKKGYMEGDTEGNFRPTMALTRAEAATILLNVKKNEPVIGANADELADSDCLTAHGGQGGVFTAGKGTKAEPYEIHTESQLNHIRMHATEGAFYILKKNVAITEDYAVNTPKDPDDPDWSAGNFEPIGSKSKPFKGTLDGNGFIVSGLNIMGTAGRGDGKRPAGYAGLFGYLAKGSVIRDLTIDASTIEGNQYVGAFAGYNEGRIEDSLLGRKGIVSGQTDTGGFAGYSSNILTSLTNRGKVTGGVTNTGGIAGSISAPDTALLDCRNEGTVTGAQRTGGVTGVFTSPLNSESIISECYNDGTVTSEGSLAGGIAGYVIAGYYSASIENCANSEQVAGSGVNGGIAGSLDNEKSGITQCRNTGSVEGGNAGGITGNNGGKISHCYNSGTVTAEVGGGGIAAFQKDSDGEISKCYNEGNVTAKNNSGGIVGENGAAVFYCYNSGKVRGSGNSGGIAAKNTGTVRSVYNSGVVTGEKNSGSLVARNGGTLDTAFWLNTADTTAVGLEDDGSSKKTVMGVTHEELSGQKKIKPFDRYEMLIDLLNAKAENWKYLYRILIPAPGNTTVISDGGGVVAPLEVPNTDSTGNTVDPADLNSKYLYPAIIN